PMRLPPHRIPRRTTPRSHPHRTARPPGAARSSRVGRGASLRRGAGAARPREEAGDRRAHCVGQGASGHRHQSRGPRTRAPRRSAVDRCAPEDRTGRTDDPRRELTSPMSALPFSDFLELLRARGMGVGLHEHLAVGRLLEHWDSTNRADLRDALAALVARHEGEVETIRGLFDECYPPDDAIDQDSGSGGPRTYRLVGLLDSRRGWAAGMAALVLASAISYAAYY